MNPALKVAAGVAGGYVLGRRKKLRYAVGLGAALLGKRLDLNPSRMVLTGVKSLRELPEVMDLSDTVREDLVASGRRAAMTLMTSRLDAMSDGLRDRTGALESGGRGEQDEELAHDDVYPDDDYEDAPDEIDLRDDKDRGEPEYDDDEDEGPDAEYDDEDEGPDAEYDDEDEADEDIDDEPVARRRSSSRRRARASA